MDPARKSAIRKLAVTGYYMYALMFIAAMLLTYLVIWNNAIGFGLQTGQYQTLVDINHFGYSVKSSGYLAFCHSPLISGDNPLI